MALSRPKRRSCAPAGASLLLQFRNGCFSGSRSYLNHVQNRSSRDQSVMGDSGEGLIDNEGKIQERMEELQRNRERARKPEVENPERLRQIESLQLARKEIAHQLENTAHEARKTQLTAALTDIDRRIAEMQAAPE